MNIFSLSQENDENGLLGNSTGELDKTLISAGKRDIFSGINLHLQNQSGFGKKMKADCVE